MLFSSDQSVLLPNLTQTKQRFGMRKACLATTCLTTCYETCQKELVSRLTTRTTRFEPQLLLFYRPTTLKHEKSKAVTGHRSDTIIQSYCERPTLNQFKHMSSTLSSFVDGKANTAVYRCHLAHLQLALVNC